MKRSKGERRTQTSPTAGPTAPPYYEAGMAWKQVCRRRQHERRAWHHQLVINGSTWQKDLGERVKARPTGAHASGSHQAVHKHTKWQPFTEWELSTGGHNATAIKNDWSAHVGPQTWGDPRHICLSSAVLKSKMARRCSGPVAGSRRLNS